MLSQQGLRGQFTAFTQQGFVKARSNCAIEKVSNEPRFTVNDAHDM